MGECAVASFRVSNRRIRLFAALSATLGAAAIALPLGASTKVVGVVWLISIPFGLWQLMRIEIVVSANQVQIRSAIKGVRSFRAGDADLRVLPRRTGVVLTSRSDRQNRSATSLRVFARADRELILREISAALA
jgi:hypothetical protein